MKFRKILVGILYGFGLMLVISCSPAKEFHSGTQGKKSVTLAEDGAWCWFGDPRAVYYEGKYRRTYAGWIDHEGNICVGYYDHDLRQIASKIIFPKLLADDHNNPTLHILPGGKLMALYARHMKDSPMYMQVALEPESISDWGPPEKLELNDLEETTAGFDWYSYPALESLEEENGKLFLFWRGLNSKQSFSISTDTARTWHKAYALFPPDTISPAARPYLKISSNGFDRIHLAFTDDHPAFRKDNNVYYACYKEGKLYRADGSVIIDTSNLPMMPHQADLVYDASVTGKPAWIWDAADDHGVPVIVYARFESDSAHIYCYARWNGSAWESHDLVNSGGWFPQTPEGEVEKQKFYSGGIVIDHEEPNVLYLSRQVNGIFEIEKWRTDDQGKTWDSEKLTRHSRYDNVRPFAVRNAGEGNPVQVLWMTNYYYFGYRNYSSSIRSVWQK
jgi:hypothetical protein